MLSPQGTPLNSSAFLSSSTADLMMKVRPIRDDDWEAIVTIENAAYTELPPESMETLQSRVLLSPETCFVAVNEDNTVLGYCLAHRWVPDGAPALHEILCALPESKNLYLHDLAVAPDAQGTGVARLICRELLALAGQKRFLSLTLVSVQNSASFWRKFGFVEVPTIKLSPSYTENAVFMMLKLASRSFS